MVSEIQLGISLAALVACVWLFLGYGQKWMVKNVNGKVHTLYIGAIATLIILEFIDYICLSNYQKDDIMSTISFGATLSSLIMSILAIIYTILSGKDGKTQLGKIEQATDELKTTAQSLGEFKNIATQIDQHIDKSFVNLGKEIESLETTIKEKIDYLNDGIVDVREKTKELREHQLNQQQLTAAKDEGHGNMQNAANARKYASNGSYAGALLLLACCYSKQNDKAFATDEMGEDFKDRSLQYLEGYIIASYAAGFIKFEGGIPDIKVTEIADGLEDAASDKVKKFIDSIHKDFRKKTIENLNAMRAYFGLEPMDFGPDKESDVNEK